MDEFTSRQFDCSVYLFLGRFCSRPVQEIVPYAAVEDAWILCQIADMLIILLQCNRAQCLVINDDIPFDRMDVSCNQLQ